MSGENLYLLKAALYLAGDRTYEKDLKDINKSISSYRENNWSYYSDLRTRGLTAVIYEGLFPGGPEGALLADRIANKLASGYYFTTQELGWCISALGKRVSNMASSFGTPELTGDGKEIKTVFGGLNQGGYSFEVSGASGYSSLSVDIPSISGGSLFAVVNIEDFGFAETIEGSKKIHSIENEESCWITKTLIDNCTQYSEYIDLQVIPLRKTEGYMADYKNFWKYSFDSVCCYEYEWGYLRHTPGDSLETINFPYLKKGARLLLSTFAEWAWDVRNN